MSEKKIIRVKLPRKTADYRHIYPGQRDPQPAILYLNCRTGEWGVTYYKSVDRYVYPADVYWNRIRRCYFSPHLPFRLVRDIVKTFAPFAQEVLDGYSEKMDSTHHEWCGCYTEHASLRWKAICDSIRAEEDGRRLAEAAKHLG